MSSGFTAKIFEELRTAIVMEDYPIGSKLPTERELAAEYNASRFAVREAIAMLSQAGFVETLPQSGTYVKDFYKDGSLDTLVQTLRIRRAIDRATMESLLQFRTALEMSAAAEAASRITSKDVELLRESLSVKEANPDNIEILTECDYAFHDRIMRASGNVISRLVFHSFKPIYSFFTSFFYSIPNASQGSLIHNRALLAALEKGDRKGAARAMEAILNFGAKTIFDSIDERERLIVIPE